MNLQRMLCLIALSIALVFLAGWATVDAHGMNPWCRPTFSGYPAYGYQYHHVHHHHYVYRPHYHHWHPAGWGNHGPVGGWYGGGFLWHSPGNCEACFHNVSYDDRRRNEGAEEVAPVVEPDDVPEEPVPDLFPELPSLP